MKKNTEIQMTDFNQLQQISQHLLPESDREQLLHPQAATVNEGGDCIFNNDFKVQSIKHPQIYLPNYQETHNVDLLWGEKCATYVGECCIGLSYVLAFCGVKRFLYEMPTSIVGLVETFGRFNRMLRPGLNFVNPCSEEVKEVDMKIMLLNNGRNTVITKDNVKVTILTSVGYRVINPITFYYILGNRANQAITELILSNFRNVVGSFALDKVITDRLEIAQMVRELSIANLPIGISIQNIFLEDVIIEAETEKYLSSLARERRIAEAKIINAASEVECADLMKETAGLLDNRSAMQIRYLELIEQIGKKSNCRFIIGVGNTVIMEIGVNKKGFRTNQ